VNPSFLDPTLVLTCPGIQVQQSKLQSYTVVKCLDLCISVPTPAHLTAMQGVEGLDCPPDS
jgi:hypothetical protein